MRSSPTRSFPSTSGKRISRAGARSSWALALVLVLLMLAPAGRVGAATSQVRAYWVDAFGPGLRTPAEIDQLVADMGASHYNVVLAQIGKRGDCYCNNAAMPRTEDPSVPAGFDPLGYLVTKAHAAHPQIQVWAWIIATAIWRSDVPPKDPAHAFNTHGPSAVGSAYWLTSRSDGQVKVDADYVMDPGHPEAAAYIVAMYTSVLKSYAVDGLNLDRIRYPDNNIGSAPSWGYNPTAVARFNAAFGRSGAPDPVDPVWTQWRRDQVTDIVKRVSLEAAQIRPGAIVSADLITYSGGPQTLADWNATRTYAQVLQDWVGWLREGYLDAAIPMNYKRDDNATQKLWYDQWDDFARDNAYGRAIVMGTAGYLNTAASTASQITRALTVASPAGRVATGAAVYSYRTPTAAVEAGTQTAAGGRAEIDAALASLYASDASVPALAWKTAPSTAVAKGVAAAKDGSALDGHAVLARRAMSGELRTTTTDGTGWFGFAGLTPGVWLFVIDPDDMEHRAGRWAKVGAGAVADVDMARR